MFVLIYTPGPAWQMVTTVAELPFYREHCTYMDQFFATGQLLAGGPFLDNQGALGLLAGEDEAQVRDIVAHDPFVQAGVVEPHLHPWQDAYFNQYQARRTQSGSWRRSEPIGREGSQGSEEKGSPTQAEQG